VRVLTNRNSPPLVLQLSNANMASSRTSRSSIHTSRAQSQALTVPEPVKNTIKSESTADRSWNAWMQTAQLHELNLAQNRRPSFLDTTLEEKLLLVPKWLLEARKTTGNKDPYKSDSYQTYFAALDRAWSKQQLSQHIAHKDVQSLWNIHENRLKTALSNRMAQCQRVERPRKTTPDLKRPECAKVTKSLSKQTAINLNRVNFLIGAIYFGKRGGEELHAMSVKKLSKVWDEDEACWKYCYSNARPDKNHHGGLKFKPRADSVVFATKDKRDPIAWIDAMLEARPEHAPDNLFLTPMEHLRDHVYDGTEPLFSVEPVKASSLKGYMRVICTEAGINKRRCQAITNHVGRATMASCLHGKNIPNTFIAEKGGWRSQEGSAGYKHTTSSQQRHISNMLHDHVTDSKLSSSSTLNGPVKTEAPRIQAPENTSSNMMIHSTENPQAAVSGMLQLHQQSQSHALMMQRQMLA